MDLISSGDLKGILDVLSFMGDSEKVMAEFYRTCGEVWREGREFWRGIEEEENKHAEHIEKMKDIISRKPERFEKGRPFNIMAAQTLIKGIQGNIEKVRSGALQKMNALFIARDIEQSVMEYRYGEVVKTDDIEYLGLVREIVSDTAAHKAKIDSEIGKTR